MIAACPVCRAPEQHDVLQLRQLPVFVNAQVRPADAPYVRRADIELVVCAGCGHLYNGAFDERLLDYDTTYENSLHFSPAFADFARGLAKRLIADHDLVGARVAELGSGPGHFLSILCDEGVATGLGYDPSYDPARLGAPDSAAVTISTEPYPTDRSLDVRLAFSQHVLEHLDDPIAALRALGRSVATRGGVVYSEVPNGQLMIEQVALWDLIYEHLSYFTPSSLDLACRLAGLEPVSGGAAFGDQFLWNEARPAPADPGAAAPAPTGVEASAAAAPGSSPVAPGAVTPDPAVVEAAIDAARSFGEAAQRAIESARQSLVDRAARGPVVLWGAGSKGATYLNLVADAAPVAGVIDINPRKWGWGVPGTDLTITGPDTVADLDPGTVLVANPLYADEIAADLAERGVSPSVEALWG